MNRGLKYWIRRLLTGQLAGDRSIRLYADSRDSFRYVEDDRSAIVDAEISGVGRVIYGGLLIHWLPPHDHEPIPPEKREEIVSMVRTYLEATGTNVVVDWEKS